MPAMTAATARKVVALALVGLLAAACGATMSPTPSQTPGPTARPPATPSPTPEPPLFPLAVIAQFTDLRVSIEQDDLAADLAAGDILVPCGLEGLALGDESLALPEPVACLPPDEIVAVVRAKGGLGLLPVGAVTPAVKVLRVGDADLFGSPSRRVQPYPVVAVSAAFEAGLIAYDTGDVRTLVSIGDTCPDRGVSQQTVVLGKGWDWALDGGTARYTGIGIDRRFTGRNGNGWPVVKAVRVGDRGKIRAILRDAEIAIDDFECPMVENFTQARGNSTIFSIDPRVAPLLADAGVDLVTIGSNHITDRGTRGLRQTMDYLDEVGIVHVGAGMDLPEALRPGVIEVRGLRFAFLGWDSTIGSLHATADSPGVATMSTANLRASVKQAREAGDIVIGLPQWNWPEYYAEFTSRALKQRDTLYELGVDHILGSGTHWAGAMSLTAGEAEDSAPRLAVTSHGNFLFGQDWSRQTQEGVLYELTFYGTRLAQVRIIPYIMLDQAQPNVTDPLTDGAYVQGQVFDASIFELP